jgi:hypothetical protein
MRARLIWFLAACALALVGCVGQPEGRRIALLAPFEGMYAEIGYNALYAARLALGESSSSLPLFAVDDGGTTEQAAQRFAALRRDDSVDAVLVVGPHATEAVLQAQEPAPFHTYLIGLWLPLPDPLPEGIFAAVSRQTISMLGGAPLSLEDILSETGPVMTGDAGVLRVFAALSDAPSLTSIVTDGRLPEPDFRARYRASDLYVPEPNPLAALIYDVTRFVSESGSGEILTTRSFPGLTGPIRFQDGFLAGRSPIRLTYDDGGNLIQVQPDTASP